MDFNFIGSNSFGTWDRYLDNFVSICGSNRNWTMKRYVKKLQELLAVGDLNVFLLVSGGGFIGRIYVVTDLGEDRVLGLHIDNGYTKNETTMVEQFMKNPVFTICM